MFILSSYNKFLLFAEQATTKINLAVDQLPQFKCCKLNHPNAGPQHMGTIHIGSERFASSSQSSLCFHSFLANRFTCMGGEGENQLLGSLV